MSLSCFLGFHRFGELFKTEDLCFYKKYCRLCGKIELIKAHTWKPWEQYNKGFKIYSSSAKEFLEDWQKWQHRFCKDCNLEEDIRIGG